MGPQLHLLCHSQFCPVEMSMWVDACTQKKDEIYIFSLQINFAQKKSCSHMQAIFKTNIWYQICKSQIVSLEL
jgi:hypothetical protein